MNRAEMLKEAERLTREQRRIRGSQKWTGLDGKPSKAPGPYERTPENEARAATILWLRRQAARSKP